MRYLFSVIGVAVVLWWTLVWRFDGKTPAQYAAQMWNSPKTQAQLRSLAQDIDRKLPFSLPEELGSIPVAAPKKVPQKQARAQSNDEPETYSDKDRRELDALVDRAQTSRND